MKVVNIGLKDFKVVVHLKHYLLSPIKKTVWDGLGLLVKPLSF